MKQLKITSYILWVYKKLKIFPVSFLHNLYVNFNSTYVFVTAWGLSRKILLGINDDLFKIIEQEGDDFPFYNVGK